MRHRHLDSTDRSLVTSMPKNSNMNSLSKRNLSSRLNTLSLIIFSTAKEELQEAGTTLSSRSQSASLWVKIRTCIIASLWQENALLNLDKKSQTWRKAWLAWKVQINPLLRNQQIGTAYLLLRLAQSTRKRLRWLILQGLRIINLMNLLIKPQMVRMGKLL